MHFNALLPELSVSDLSKSLHFYHDVLGFTIEYRRSDPPFVFLSYQGSQIMLQQAHTGTDWDTGALIYPYGRGINFQIETSEVAELLEKLKTADYPLFRPMVDSWYRENDVEHGCREFLVQDPDGYVLRFSQDLGERTAVC